MDKSEKAKWLERALIKTALLDEGVSIDSISGRELNLAAHLPADAVWRESNFD